MKIDVLLGGCPCQGFSISNSKRSKNDKRNFLYKELIHSIKEIQPKIFVFENVKGILSLNKGLFFKKIISDFKRLNYFITFKILNAVDFNIPQNRERLFLIGINKKYKIKDEIFPKKTEKGKSVKESIEYLSKQKENKLINHVFSTNVKKNISKKNLKYKSKRTF